MSASIPCCTLPRRSAYSILFSSSPYFFEAEGAKGTRFYYAFSNGSHLIAKKENTTVIHLGDSSECKK